MKESLGCVKLLYFPGGGHLLVTGYQACLGALLRMCHKETFPLPARASHGEHLNAFIYTAQAMILHPGYRAWEAIGLAVLEAQLEAWVAVC